MNVAQVPGCCLKKCPKVVCGKTKKMGELDEEWQLELWRFGGIAKAEKVGPDMQAAGAQKRVM